MNAQWIVLINKILILFFTILTLACARSEKRISEGFQGAAGSSPVSNPQLLADQFTDPYVVYYDENSRVGINHVAYWKISEEELAKLPKKEQVKAARLKPNNLSSKMFPPDAHDPISGYEVSGKLIRNSGSAGNTSERIQSISLVIPDNWNGKLVVFGMSGVRNEYGTASLLSPWLLKKGYATIGGDKGLLNGAADLFSGKHITQHWGDLMIDLAIAGEKTINSATGKSPTHTYAVGVSNGGFQVRLALEIDHERVEHGESRLFDGGFTWSAAYFPRAEIMDENQDGKVTPEEYAKNANQTLIGTHLCAALSIGWIYDEGSAANTKQFSQTPPFENVHDTLVNECGFHPDSAPIWGVYSAFFDWFKSKEGAEGYAGVGYFNRVPMPFLADFRGDNQVQAEAYSPRNIGTPSKPIKPTIYSFMEENSATLGFTETAVDYMLKIANTGEFSVPLVEIQGTKDGIISLKGQAYAYRDTIKRFGTPELHRLYLIKDGMHIDAHADPDSNIDFDLNGIPNDGNIADQMTPVQGYAEIAMEKLENWVEHEKVPGESVLVMTDPEHDTIVVY